MGSFSKGLSAVIRARGVAGKFTVKKIDRGLARIQRVLKSIKQDKSYVKAGLLGKASKRRSIPRLTVSKEERDYALAFPAVAAVLAAKAERHNAKRATAMSNVQLGLIHEFGTDTIPARPFISASFKRNRAEYRALLTRLGAGVYAGKLEYTKVLGILGQKMAADMKNYVTQGAGVPPPNAPSTLARKQAKGNSSGAAPRPLVDTGALVGSITYEVVVRGSGEENTP